MSQTTLEIELGIIRIEAYGSAKITQSCFIALLLAIG